MKRCYKFFAGFLNSQEKWLNEMASKGYRLVNTGKITYDFVKCEEDEYEYVIEFVAEKSYRNAREYKQFLEEIGYTVFYKNINLNFSIGKVRWRPYGKGMGQVSSNPGSFNKELFIVEKKKDGKPFDLHSTFSDKANYFKSLRNACMTMTAMMTFFFGWGLKEVGISSYQTIIFGVLALISLAPVIGYQKKIGSFKASAKIEE